MSLLRPYGSRELAVDLGTANTLVFVRGEGIVLFEPSVVAIDERTGNVQAVGSEAKRMIGRTPAAIRAIRPLRHGVIADFEMTEQMLRYFIRRASGGRFSFAHVVLCVPSGITKLERDAVQEATRSAGARAVYLIEEPMAAALGADLPVAEPSGSMVVDVGGGTTEVAVVSLGGIVVWNSIRVGGYEMDDAIVRHMQEAHNLIIGAQTAEAAKLEVGSAWRLGAEKETSVSGRDRLAGLLRRAAVSSVEVRAALEGTIARIVAAVKATLEATPPELAADVAASGIVLAGGGTLLRGFDRRLAEETGLSVRLAESPLTCVVRGAGRSLDELDTLRRSERPRARYRRRKARLRG